MRTKRTPPVVIGVAWLALTLAGCGGGPATQTPTAQPSPVASVVAATQTPTAQPSPVASEAATVLWPAPPNPLELTVAAGLQPERKEHLNTHLHAHLDVFVDGDPIAIPAGIGINIDDPEVRRFDEPDGTVSYGEIQLCRTPCISPLHTHDQTGIIHTESQSPEPNTLGQFFIEWGVSLSDSCVGDFCSPEPVAVYVNGELSTQDPREIELTDLKVIVIVIGTPPAVIPSTADFSNV